MFKINYSKKFWIIFWLSTVIFLSGWFLFWNTKNQSLASTAEIVMKVLPIENHQKKEYAALFRIGENFLIKNDQEKDFLVLLQNNLEIRPGGGFLGAFAVVKVKNGKMISMETHDLSNFEARVPAKFLAPYPLEQIMKTRFWKMRDSNWSPDFAINAQKAEEFYALGGGEEKFDGVIGITSNVLTSVLKATGPIAIDGYPGTYDSENAILALEYQVEKAFDEQGIEREDRKSIMGEMASEIEKKIFALPLSQKIQLVKILLADLRQKDVQLYFQNPKLQNAATEADWAGAVDQNWNNDYLMLSDANLGSFKSDYYVKRSVDYAVDLSQDVPTAKLKITYEHTAKQKDWMTRDYTDYLRVYVPKNSELISQQNFNDARIGEDFNKKYFGAIVRVPIDSSKTVEISYTLPELVKNDYNLKIQKQAGLNAIPVSVHVINADGTRKDYSMILNGDIVLNNAVK